MIINTQNTIYSTWGMVINIQVTNYFIRGTLINTWDTQRDGY